MLKVVIVFNGTLYPKRALDFAFELNKTQSILLTGIFMPQAEYSILWKDAGTSAVPAYPLLEEVSDEIATKNIDRFITFCEDHEMSFRVHLDIRNFVLPELIQETRFADLLFIDSKQFYNSIGNDEVSSHLKDALHAAECPVIVLPEDIGFPQRNIILYDGTASSVYAIKQFAYLLPELCNNETLLAFLRTETDVCLPNEKEIVEFAGQHFNELHVLQLDFNPKKYLSTWLDEQKEALIISGSFGRSKTSMLFRKSFVSELIADYTLPLFIAHK